MDSLSTMMSVSPKTQTIRKLMDLQVGKITLLWVPGHVGITGNENASNFSILLESKKVFLFLTSSRRRKPTFESIKQKFQMKINDLFSLL
jgi:hypothetical protein